MQFLLINVNDWAYDVYIYTDQQYYIHIEVWIFGKISTGMC
jgi:hypothetical protein